MSWYVRDEEVAIDGVTHCEAEHLGDIEDDSASINKNEKINGRKICIKGENRTRGSLIFFLKISFTPSNLLLVRPVLVSKDRPTPLFRNVREPCRCDKKEVFG